MKMIPEDAGILQGSCFSRSHVPASGMTTRLTLPCSQTPDMLLGFQNQSAGFCSRSGDGRCHCYALQVLFALALSVGIVGNAAALLSYACSRRSSSGGRVFLLNLALCDSAWTLTLPVTLYFTSQSPRLRDRQILCQFRRMSFNVNVYGGILFLALISFDRFVGTVHPVSSIRWWDAGKARLCAAGTWAALAVNSVPDAVATALWPESAGGCMHYMQGPLLYVGTMAAIRTAVGFLLPFSAMLAFYTMAAGVLRRLPRGARPGGAQRAGAKPLRLVTAAILVFAVSFLPYHAMVVTVVSMRIRNQITPSNTHVLYTCYEFLEAMCSVSSCLNPVLYIMASEQFQRRLRALKRDRSRRLCCRASRRVGVVT
ncbi:P2Y purinoceptor 6-like [Betta splendens]|uniref:P2Y purinoceptor 6-like n=1 Tax=Betta splendens TaxID=158456 RepID=A0A9W2XV20_BETSP|nr:P2Y purinoceptor 6-like [Betta splendens]